MSDEIRMTNDELPESWTTFGFTSVFDIQGGTQPPKSTFVYEPTDGYVQLLQIRDFGARPVPTFIRDARGLKKCKKEDVLIARYGASLGRILTGLEGAYNVAMAKVVIPPGIDRRFTLYLLNSEAFQNPLMLVSRSAQNGFNKEDLAKFQLPLAPLAEQKRIADKLEAVLGRVDACRARLDRVPALLKRFRQSVLAAATTGKLTVEWRMTNGVNDEWENLKLGQLVAEPLRNGKSVRDGKGIPVLRLTALRGGKFDWREAKQGDWTGLDPTRFFVKDGDFLIIRGNGSQDLVGRGCLAENPPDEMAFPDTLIRIRPDKDKLLPSYLVIVWNTSEVRSQIEQAAKTTTGLWKVAQGDLESISIPLPPLPEQQEIVRRVEDLFAFADRIEARLATAQKTVERLTPATLAKAFRGELVPQDLNDEPASTLLERLRCPSDMTPAKAKRAKCS